MSRTSYFIPARMAYKTPDFGCIFDNARQFKMNKAPYILSLHKPEIVDGLDMPRWIALIESWGFPLHTEETETEWIVTFKQDDYNTDMHFLAAFTMVRYVLKDVIMFGRYGVGSGFGSDGLTFRTYALQEKYPTLDSFQCFQLAHYYEMSGYHDRDHCCFTDPSKLLTLSEMQAKLPKLQAVNDLFYKEEVNKTFHQLKALSKTNEEKLLNLLI